ncbi:putative short chain dehydrogenase [Gonapodya prolifera JEL478]|uniref:Putative short chain dehydrogenase n=1 Tax=Gonapodya prolifera (strain JEL478) TaxID=1344416 RepID=A0A139AS40_GONPJ|nr:putative short chain dehydrogenase [Gonapodya prolifera JEL478]|eukprot:KXS19363.1 putative short chain dehydrogenase [Gonapodya prolifera JEL478]
MPQYPLPNFSTDLKGRVALVTGASAGLGVRFAKVLAACGAKVGLAARRIDRLEALAKEIKAAGGIAIPIQMDATDAKAMIAAVEKLEKEFGTVDILVNNAGIPDAQRAHKMSTELIDQVIGVNLRGPWILACEVARRLIAAKKPGNIVNISSTAHFRYDGGGAALYAVTKTAIARMTEALAAEWAHYNINVNCICPGAFISEMMEGMIKRVAQGKEELMAAGFARKRIGQPEQLDSTLLYLVSPSSDFVTGAIIKVNDGQGSRGNM